MIKSGLLELVEGSGLTQSGVTESGHLSESSFQDWLEINQ